MVCWTTYVTKKTTLWFEVLSTREHRLVIHSYGTWVTQPMRLLVTITCNVSNVVLKLFASDAMSECIYTLRWYRISHWSLIVLLEILYLARFMLVYPTFLPTLCAFPALCFIRPRICHHLWMNPSENQELNCDSLRFHE